MKYYSIKTHDSDIKLEYIDNYIIHEKIKIKLFNTKNKIAKVEDWDILKKKYNSFEYIYTSNKKYNICKLSPISRSYFKLCEILHDCLIHNKINNTLCMADAPGGFIQYLSGQKLSNNIYINTLISSDSSVPDWNLKHLKLNNIIYTHNSKNNGDLLNLNVVKDIIENIKPCDLITADGGIDFTQDYNNQEYNSYSLIYSEIFLALNAQIDKGSFIIKLFDIFNYKTVQLIYILNLCYDELIFIKPHTSRPFNSEKYLVCKLFKKNETVIKLMETHWDKKENIDIVVPDNFIKKINEYNELFVDNQIKNINNILTRKFIINNTQKCIDWCKEYKMPYLN